LLDLQAALLAFVESKRTWLARLASEEGMREKALLLKAELLADDGAAWVNEADALAPALVRRWDVRGAAHCGARCADGDGLAAHRAACSFRPVPCPHAGCFEVVSAGRLESHDDACGHKPLPCVLGCPCLVKKKDMPAHVAGPCECRPVECPFAYLGCTEPVRCARCRCRVRSV
jgi:homogentisate solanesyltransferase